MKLFIGNLSSETTEEELRLAATAFGEVSEVTLASGHGFVVMASSEAGQAALTGLQGHTLHGQNLKVSEARPERRNLRGGPSTTRGFGNTGFGNQKGPHMGSSGSKGNFRKTTGNKV